MELQVQEQSTPIAVHKKDQVLLSFILAAQKKGDFVTHEKLAPLLGIKAPAIAKRLRLLRRKKVIGTERVGKSEWVYYLLVPVEDVEEKKTKYQIISILGPVFSQKSVFGQNSPIDINGWCLGEVTEEVRSNFSSSISRLQSDILSETVKFNNGPLFESCLNKVSECGRDTFSSISPSPNFFGGGSNSVNLCNFSAMRSNVKLFNLFSRKKEELEIRDYSFNWDLYIKYDYTTDKYKLDLFYDCTNQMDIEVRKLEVIEQLELENDVDVKTYRGALKVRGIPESRFFLGYWNSNSGREQSGLMSKIYSDLKQAIEGIKQNGQKVARPATTTDRSNVTSSRDGNAWMAKHEAKERKDWNVWDVEVEWNALMKENGMRSFRWNMAERKMCKNLLNEFGGELVASVVEHVIGDWEGIKERHKWIRNNAPSIKMILGLKQVFVEEVEYGVDVPKANTGGEWDEEAAKNMPADHGWSDM